MGLQEFVIRRIVQLIFVYWMFLTMLFVLFRLAPGDPTAMFIDEGMSEEARQQMIADMGLDQPLHIQYFEYLGMLLQGDLGHSFLYREPVTSIIWTTLGNTIALMVVAMVFAYAIGVTFGAVMGWVRGTDFEKSGITLTLIFRSSPEFWTGILLLMVFTFWLGLFPTGGMRTAGGGWESRWELFLSFNFLWHLTLPALTGIIYYMATPTLLMRNSMLEVLDSDFIEIKNAEGLPKHVVLFNHAVRNSILPIVTIAAVSVGSILSGSLIIETVFNWPGMGREMVRSLSYNDYPVAQATFFLMGSITIFMNFIADLLYVYLDPRVKYD